MEQKGGSFEQVGNGILEKNRLAGIRLTEAFIYLREKAEPFNGIFERRIVVVCDQLS